MPETKHRRTSVPVLFHEAILNMIEEEKSKAASECGDTLTLSRIVNRSLASHFGLDLDAIGTSDNGH